MYWNHMAWGWGIFMTLGWVILLGLFVALVVNASRYRPRRSARELLDERLAAGEISVEEYERARAAMASQAGSHPASGPPAPA